MTQTHTQERPSETPPRAPRRPRLPRWLLWTAGTILVLGIVAAAIVNHVIHNAEPILRKRLIATLEQRFQSPVQLDALHISLLHGMEVTGSGLRIDDFGLASHPGQTALGAQPMLSVANFTFHAGLLGLFQHVTHVDGVTASGIQLTIPPKPDRGPIIVHNSGSGKMKLSIVFDKIVCRDLTLTIATNKPGKFPLVFQIRDVTLHDVGPGKPFPFDAWLINAKPVGDIHSTGSFGPWQTGSPRDTPVRGSYTFTHADLGPIKGISGILSSTGSYGGTLGEIGVVGDTDTPDFALDNSQHPEHLRTHFNATVDGTNGDTILNSIQATLDHTQLDVKGLVVHADRLDPGSNVPGHVIDLTVVSDHARIEDLLRLAIKTNPPLMQGAMILSAHLTIPPGQVSVSRKIRIQGRFAIRQVVLANPKWQGTVNKLSERASGNPDQANSADAAPVVSSMSGSFSLANGLLAIPRLDYQIPGAKLELAGKYGLDGKTFDFNGIVRTQATASQMLTGWKSILAIPLDPLLKKNGAGLQVPIKISGTGSTPKFGLDINKLFSPSKKAPSMPAKP